MNFARRLVLDTGVLVSAAICPGSVPALAFEKALQAFIAGYRAHVHLFDMTLTISDCPDPKDNMFLALAQTAEAELTIASDPHLRGMHPWRGIPILPPSAFLIGID